MIDSLVRPDIKKLIPYTSARDLYQDGLFLDANENPFGSVVKGPFKIQLNRYPDPYSQELKKVLSIFLKVSPDHLFVGVGSDEIIDLVIRLFVSNNEEVAVCEPTYGMYRVYAEISGVKVRSCLLTPEFQIDFSALEKILTSKTKIVFFCSPNNPTANLINSTDIETVCREFKGIVVVDEAYIEFAERESLIYKVKSLKKLIVLRTFSKAWGLAGARVGYGVMNPEIVRYLNKIKPPYNLSSVSAFLAKEAIKNKKQYLKWKKEILAERKKLAKELGSLGFHVFPSEANFILIRHPRASRLAKKLVRQFGIIVRDVSNKPQLSDCVRITVGRPEQNKALLKAVGEML